MSMKEQLLEKYTNPKLIYPFEGNNKFIYSHALDWIKENNNNKVLSIRSINGNITPMEVYTKLNQNSKIDLFSYSAVDFSGQPLRHEITIYCEDDELLIACQLIKDEDKIFELLMK